MKARPCIVYRCDLCALRSENIEDWWKGNFTNEFYDTYIDPETISKAVEKKKDTKKFLAHSLDCILNSIGITFDHLPIPYRDGLPSSRERLNLEALATRESFSFSLNRCGLKLRVKAKRLKKKHQDIITRTW